MECDAHVFATAQGLWLRFYQARTSLNSRPEVEARLLLVMFASRYLINQPEWVAGNYPPQPNQNAKPLKASAQVATVAGSCGEPGSLLNKMVLLVATGTKLG